MNTSNNLTLIYDDSCPLCHGYSNLFVKFNLIGKRSKFSNLNHELLHTMDLQKCKNEIPLHNSNTNSFVYGIDALFMILGNRFGLLNILFKNKLFYFLIKKLYYFISFNRRVIAGSKPTPCEIDCTPDFNLKYRMLYLIFASCIGLNFFYQSHFLLFGIILSLVLILVSVFHQQSIEFLGHQFTVVLISSFVCFVVSYSSIPYLPLIVSLLIFIILSYKRMQVIQSTFNGNGEFVFNYIICKGLFLFSKFLLMLKSKKYSSTNLPNWLKTPLSENEIIGKDYYKKYVQEEGLTYEQTNSKGLCHLSQLNDDEFDSTKVDERIIDFYKNTHLYDFTVKHMWHGWYSPFIKYIIKHYNDRAEQFNFNGIENSIHSIIENQLTPIQTPTGEVMNWVRHNRTLNKTMFSGFYHVDTLPYQKNKTCVTTKFPLQNICMMVKLKPTNEPNGGFSFKSEDKSMGGYSFYIVQKRKENYYVTTLPVYEKIELSIINNEVFIDHQFYLHTKKLMSFEYKTIKNNLSILNN